MQLLNGTSHSSTGTGNSMIQVRITSSGTPQQNGSVFVVKKAFELRVNGQFLTTHIQPRVVLSCESPRLRAGTTILSTYLYIPFTSENRISIDSTTLTSLRALRQLAEATFYYTIYHSTWIRSKSTVEYSHLI